MDKITVENEKVFFFLNVPFLMSSNPLFLYKAGGKKISFVEYFEEGISSQSSFTNSPKQCLYLESYIAHLLKKEVSDSPFMIHSFIHSITVPISSYDCFCLSQHIYIDKNQHVLVSLSKPLKIHIIRTITSNSSTIFPFHCNDQEPVGKQQPPAPHAGD